MTTQVTDQVREAGAVQGAEPHRGYKWIARHMASLNPYEDYEEIWKLTTCYYVDHFMMNFLYTNQFPYYVMTPQAAEAVARSGKGKVVHQQDARERDTAHHFWIWFEKGPSHPDTQASIKRVNAIHQGIANKYPGRYSHDVDFTYTMCMLAADLHRLRVRTGLPGYTDNQKIAAHLYWQGIAQLFRKENDEPILDFPADWDSLMAYLDEHEARDLPHTEDGATVTEAILQQWENRWFPKPLRWAGRSMQLALMGEAPHRVHRLPYPNAVMTWLSKFAFAGLFFVKERVLPDPQVTTPHKTRVKAGAIPAASG